jgi:hypothetical protein
MRPGGSGPKPLRGSAIAKGEEVRDLLKNNGYKWARSEGAWQRQRTLNGIGNARRIVREIKIIMEGKKTTVEFLVTGRDMAYSPCTAEALEIAVAAEKLDAEGKRIAMTVIKGLETQLPLEGSKSIVGA